MNNPYIKIVNGNLLDATEQFIIHQCNCVTNQAKTLAKQIFDKYPYANTYKKRSNNKLTYNVPGTIDIMGNGTDKRYIINMYSQFYPQKAKFSNDSYEKRLIWFRDCLDQIYKIPNLESIALPYNIGCGVAGGNWEKYYNEIVIFANKIKKQVTIYKLEL